MFNVGMSELLCFAVIAVLVLGPDKLPEAARFAGKTYSKFKRMMSSVQNEIDRELRLTELQNQMQQELQRIQDLEQRLQQQMQQPQSLPDAAAITSTTDTPQKPLKAIDKQQPLQWLSTSPDIQKVWHPQFKHTQHLERLACPLTSLAKSA